MDETAPDPHEILPVKMQQRAAQPLQFGVGLDERGARMGQGHGGGPRVGFGLFDTLSRRLNGRARGLAFRFRCLPLGFRFLASLRLRGTQPDQFRFLVARPDIVEPRCVRSAN